MRKKGFTLLELLAVIVVLAVIVLIAVPLILGIIEEVNKGAFKSSFRNILHGAELKIINNDNVHLAYRITNGVISYANQVEGEPDIEIDGNISKYNGVFYATEKGETAGYIDNGTWCVYKLKNEEEVTLLDSGECETAILNEDSSGGGLVCEACDTTKIYTQEEVDQMIAEAVEEAVAEKEKENPYPGYKLNHGSMTLANVISKGYVPLVASVSKTDSYKYGSAVTNANHTLFVQVNATVGNKVVYPAKHTCGYSNTSSNTLLFSSDINLLSLYDYNIESLKTITSISADSVTIKEWLEPLS